MTSFRKLEDIQNRLAKYPDGESAFGFLFDRIISATEAVKDGNSFVLAGANNYLGLNHHPDVIAASVKTTREQGLGTTGSRLANGTYPSHLKLEQDLASFYDCPQALTFSTGYQANVGILSSLCDPDTAVIVDGERHASIIDGCRLGGAKIRRFAHNDVADLKTKLQSVPASRKMVVVEGIYSMSGDVAPLREIADITQAENAVLIVDEAHSVGVLGTTGRGLAEALGVEDKVDMIVGTFSKSLGAVGGFAVSKSINLRHLKLDARSYVYSASLPPGIVEAVRTGFNLIKTEPALRLRLQANILALGETLENLGLAAGHPQVPIFALPFANPFDAYYVWRALLDNFIYVNLVVPPASPNGQAMLRLSVSAAHTNEQIGNIADALKIALKKI